MEAHQPSGSIRETHQGRAETGHRNLAKRSHAYEIDRHTGHKWMRRILACDREGLADLFRLALLD